ncbi:hypothetical protein YC2023_043734 [Brassica napus]
MPLSMENTRYSLVKGERIFRFVLTTWLRDFLWDNKPGIEIGADEMPQCPGLAVWSTLLGAAAAPLLPSSLRHCLKILFFYDPVN